MSTTNSADYSYKSGEYNPDAPPLTNTQTAEAKKDLVRAYPKVARYKVDPPIQNQDITMLSYMLLKEPSSDGVYGFVKARGTWASPEIATTKSETIIRTGDSIFPIHLAPTGYWTPITNNEAYTQDQLDVKGHDQDRAMRDRAAKENAEKDKELQREIQERKERIQRDTDDIDADPTSLDFYTKKQVSLKELKAHLRKVKDQEKSVKKSIKKVQDEVEQLGKVHPEYTGLWLENYNKARRAVGLKDYSEADLNNISFLGSME